MMKFSDFLEEQAIAKSGDYDFGNLDYLYTGITGYVSKKVTNVLHKFDFNINGKNTELFIIECKSSHPKQKYYCIAKEELDTTSEPHTVRFKPLAAMLLEYTTKYRGLGYGPFRIVKGVETLQPYWGKGIGKKLYTILVDDFKWVLMGDEEQYEGARNLWTSLSKTPGFNVDIVELVTGKIIAKNVKLKDALDPRIWTDEDLFLTGTKEERIRGRFNRLVLTKVTN
ncbi:hypothetical protein BJL57_09365 [Campylobacter jejuni]|nr:hypothetical protein [Campylobacter jejuni]